MSKRFVRSKLYRTFSSNGSSMDELTEHVVIDGKDWHIVTQFWTPNEPMIEATTGFGDGYEWRFDASSALIWDEHSQREWSEWDERQQCFVVRREIRSIGNEAVTIWSYPVASNNLFGGEDDNILKFQPVNRISGLSDDRSQGMAA